MVFSSIALIFMWMKINSWLKCITNYSRHFYGVRICEYFVCFNLLKRTSSFVYDDHDGSINFGTCKQFLEAFMPHASTACLRIDWKLSKTVNNIYHQNLLCHVLQLVTP